MTDFLKEVGTTEVARDSLNMDVNKPASLSADQISGRLADLAQSQATPISHID